METESKPIEQVAATKTPEQPTQLKPLGEIDKLAAALAKAQGEIKPPAKTKTVDFQPERGSRVKYKYADLADVMEAIKGPLSKNGLSIMHRIHRESRSSYMLETTLLHESGQSISSWYPLPDPITSKPQTFGGLLTYARRYSVSALVGIASDDDQDAVVDLTDEKKPREKKATEPEALAASKPKNSAPASKTQIEQINMLSQDRGIAPGELQAFMRHCYPGVNSKNMQRWQAEEIVALLEDKDTTAGTIMARVARAQKDAEVAQPYPPGAQ